MRKYIILFALLLLPGIVYADSFGTLPLNGGWQILAYATSGQIFGALLRSKIYLAVGLVGMVGSLWYCLTKARSLVPFYIYVATVLFLFMIFAPRRAIPQIKSHAEVKAPSERIAYTAEEFAEEHGYTGGEVPRGLYFLSHGIDSIIQLICGAIDQVTTRPGEGLYGSRPSYIWAKIRADEIGVTDASLRQRAKEFYNTYYNDALANWDSYGKNTHIDKSFPSWPGDKRLKDSYPKIPKNGWDEWEKLRNELYSHALLTNPPSVIEGTLMFFKARLKKGGFYSFSGKDDMGLTDTNEMDLLVQKLFRDTEASAGGILALDSLGTKEQNNSFLQRVVRAVTAGIANLGTQFLRATVQILPAAQAYCTYFAISLFPLILLISLLPLGPGFLVQMHAKYWLSILWLRSWSIGVVLINSFGQVNWETSSYLGDHLLHFALAVFTLGTPAITYALIMSGGMQGVSMITSAATGLAGGVGSVAATGVRAIPH